MKPTLAEFLLARIDEDEEAAQSAIHFENDTGEWSVYPECTEVTSPIELDCDFIHIYDEGGHTAEQAAHIARWDPKRVIAECAARRRIVEEYLVWMGSEFPPGTDMKFAYWRTLRWLAQCYADHPDYRAEWTDED